jgi:hypothetical protein
MGLIETYEMSVVVYRSFSAAQGYTMTFVLSLSRDLFDTSIMAEKVSKFSSGA